MGIVVALSCGWLCFAEWGVGPGSSQRFLWGPDALLGLWPFGPKRGPKSELLRFGTTRVNSEDVRGGDGFFTGPSIWMRIDGNEVQLGGFFWLLGEK